MTLIAKLKKTALELADDHWVTDVRIGLCYTAVRLDRGQVGLAYTFRDSLKGGCSLFNTLKTLAGSPAKDLIALFDSNNLIDSALALATANALFNLPNKPYLSGPALEQITLYPDDCVGMVGNFTPLVQGIRSRTKQLYVFEQQSRPEENILAIDMADKLLPQCQVALITATAIINGSIDHLLALTAKCREVVILGSSTPLYKEVFIGSPVTLLSGIIVNDAQKLLQIVSEGGGTPAFKQAVNKVNLIIG